MKRPTLIRPASGARRWGFGGSLCFGAWSLLHGASLQIEITPRFSGEPIQADSRRYQSSSGETFSITRVSYLVSGFALERADGSWLELPNQTAWLDLEKGRSSHHVQSVPSGDYRALRFHLGLDEKENHADVAKFPPDHPLNPNLNGLHWSWQGGYIFLALEGRWGSERLAPPRPDSMRTWEQAETVLGAPIGWSYHLARDTNRTRITLAARLDLARDTTLELDFDLATLLSAPRPLSFAKDGSSTHSRDGDPIAAALVANLPGAFRVRRVSALAIEPTAAVGVNALSLPEKFTPYRFQMGGTFPIPNLPRDNPLIEERVALGGKLFRETALSRDGTISCASCHDSKHAFSDPRQYSVGVRGQTGTRNAMPLFNLAWKSSFFWDGRAPSLRAQALMPIQDHAEMDESLVNVVAKLSSSRREEARSSIHEKEQRGKEGKESSVASATSPLPLFPSPPRPPDYPALFNLAFGSPEITPEKIGLALESFVLTLTSFDSKFDRVLRGEGKFAEDEQRGFELFMTEYDPRREQFGADCFHCHGGPLFQSQTFANNGLDSEFQDPGRAKITGKDSDRGKFSTPSLRNVTLTAPYMHDGRFTTLEQVVAHYCTGLKRSETLDPNLAKHPDGGVRLNDDDQRALVAFLRTLTDARFETSVGAAAQLP